MILHDNESSFSCEFTDPGLQRNTGIVVTEDRLNRFDDERNRARDTEAAQYEPYTQLLSELLPSDAPVVTSVGELYDMARAIAVSTQARLPIAVVVQDPRNVRRGYVAYADQTQQLQPIYVQHTEGVGVGTRHIDLVMRHEPLITPLTMLDIQKPEPAYPRERLLAHQLRCTQLIDQPGEFSVAYHRPRILAVGSTAVERVLRESNLSDLWQRFQKGGFAPQV